MWQMDSNRPIYIQLVERITKEIIAGKYHPGEKMPTVRELAEIARVNPNTMQKAFSQLEQEGMLFTDRTVGRYVTQDTVRIKERDTTQKTIPPNNVQRITDLRLYCEILFNPNQLQNDSFFRAVANHHKNGNRENNPNITPEPIILLISNCIIHSFLVPLYYSFGTVRLKNICSSNILLFKFLPYSIVVLLYYYYNTIFLNCQSYFKFIYQPLFFQLGFLQRANSSRKRSLKNCKNQVYHFLSRTRETAFYSILLSTCRKQFLSKQVHNYHQCNTKKTPMQILPQYLNSPSQSEMPYRSQNAADKGLPHRFLL